MRPRPAHSLVRGIYASYAQFVQGNITDFTPNTSKYVFKGRCVKMGTVDAGTIKGSGRVKFSNPNQIQYQPPTAYCRAKIHDAL